LSSFSKPLMENLVGYLIEILIVVSNRL